jgi:GMP synthase (glutamine-hydrolysing)
VNTTHVDTVAVLPDGAKCLARTELESHAVIAFGSRVRGVQFHPEIDGAVMRGYVELRRERLR